MKALYIQENFKYDGTQLRALYGYLEHKVLGPSIVAWQGPCEVSFEHMIDGEDLLQQAKICGDHMLHFIVEIFDRDLFSGVSLQRLFAAIVRDYLSVQTGKDIRRDGDDIFVGKGKLSISIASKSPVSVMIHFAMNVVNKGTPVATAGLQEDLSLDAKQVAEDLMRLFVQEYTSIQEATQKVRPL